MQSVFAIDKKQPWPLSEPQLLSLYLPIFRFIVIMAFTFYSLTFPSYRSLNHHNNSSASSVAQRGMNKTPIPLLVCVLSFVLVILSIPHRKFPQSFS